MIETGYRILDITEKTKSLSKTGEELHLTPSAVSRSVQKLEKDLGIQLFIRKSDGVELTKDARSILPFVRMALNTERRMGEEIERIHASHRGVLRIGTFSSVGCCWMPAIARRMKAEHPNVDLRIHQGGYDDLTSLLDSGDLDVIFASIPIKKSYPTFPLYKDRLLCITPKDFVPANPQYITIDELRDQTFILPCEGMDFDATAFLKNCDLHVENPHYVQDDNVIAAMVEAGLGISIMPELVVETVRADLGVYPVMNAPYRTIGIVSQREEYSVGAVKSFIKLVRRFVQEEYPEELPYFR